MGAPERYGACENGRRSDVCDAKGQRQVTDRETAYRGHQSDPALVQACLRGEESAWEELVDRYERLVYSIPRRLGLSAADADDVFQNVFATLVRRLGDLRDQSRLSAWLITTTYRESWRIGKRAERHAPLDERMADAAAPPLDEVARWEREQLVRQALRRLDDRCRDLVTALFLEPDTPGYQAIAERLGMSVGSIGPTRARCFKRLEGILIELGVDAGM
jgi:RNA polymerase sigma factor (sigma-70 family)